MDDSRGVADGRPPVFHLYLLCYLYLAYSSLVTLLGVTVMSGVGGLLRRQPLLPSGRVAIGVTLS